MKNSQYIEDFLNFINSVESSLPIEKDEVNRCDKLVCDLEHKLELDDDLSYHDMAKIAKQIKLVKQERRAAKNLVEAYEPIVKFIQDNPIVKNKLPQVLGEVRKIEKYHENRSYKPRVLEGMTVCAEPENQNSNIKQLQFEKMLAKVRR